MLDKFRASEPRSLMTGLMFSAVLLLVALIAIFSLVALGKFFIERINDPIVLYYGEMMRASQLEAQATHSIYCTTLSLSA
jgi:nitrogen fixation/metabolism regulation signal transduction histidine kinase